MPIYEYQCKACGHNLEVLQKVSDEPLKECPVCHKSTLDKLVSAAGFQLKGTGWYATDYKAKSKQPSSTDSLSSTDSGSTETKTNDSNTKDSKSTDSAGSS